MPPYSVAALQTQTRTDEKGAKKAKDTRRETSTSSNHACPSFWLGQYLGRIANLDPPLAQRRHRSNILATELLSATLQLLPVVASMLTAANVEDGVQLLQRAVLGLGDEEVGHEEADHVPRGVVVEATGGGDALHHLGPREAQHKVETPGDGRGRGHALCPDVEGKRLGGIREGHRAKTWRVAEHEDEDACHEKRASRLQILDLEVGTGPEQADGKDRQCNQQQLAAPESVNGEDSRKSANPVESTTAKRGP